MFMASVATVDGSDPTGSAWNGLGRDCMILLSCCGWAGVGIVEDVGEVVQGNGDVDLRHQSGRQWHEVGSRRRPRWAGRSDEVAQSSEHPLQRDAVGHQALGPGGRLRGAGDVADGTVLGDGAARGACVRRARWSTEVRGRRDGGGSGREIGPSAPAGLLLTGAQGAQAHGDQGIGAQLRGGAPVAGGSRGGGYGAESGIQQERVHGGQEHRHLVHALSCGTWPGDAALRRVAEAAPAGPVGVLDGQGAVDVAGELRMGTARGARQHVRLYGPGRGRARSVQAAGDQGGLGLVDQARPMQSLRGSESAGREGPTAVQNLLRPHARDPQAAGDLAGGGEPVLLGADDVRAVVHGSPLSGAVAQLGGAGQTGGRQGGGPLGPGGQPSAGGHHFAEGVRPQVRQSIGRLRDDLHGLGGLGQRPFTGVRRPVEKGSPGCVGYVGARSRRRRRAQKRPQEPLDHVGQLRSRDHGGQTLQSLFSEVDRMDRGVGAAGGIAGSRRAAVRREGRRGGAAVFEHMYSLVDSAPGIQPGSPKILRPRSVRGPRSSHSVSVPASGRPCAGPGPGLHGGPAGPMRPCARCVREPVGRGDAEQHPDGAAPVRARARHPASASRAAMRPMPSVMASSPVA